MTTAAVKVTAEWLTTELLDVIEDAKIAFSARGDYEVSSLGARLTALKMLTEQHGLGAQIDDLGEDLAPALAAEVEELLASIGAYEPS